MSDIYIKVKQLSKVYQLDNHYPSDFKNVASAYIKSLFKRRKSPSEIHEIWAVKNISFELQGGDVMGIIGKNGSGKSTLLKVLSEITEPTSGEVEISGSIASVLEIGMGFHPELSGRENIYLSGAILGMSRKEINNNLHDIISFSEIEKFIDSPVKHYSSGMFVRLSFSIVANIAADILLFDEVLSVGDTAFRLKALQRIKQLTRQGKIIIIATHNLSEVVNLCNKAILLKDGQIEDMGTPLGLISKYSEEAYKEHSMYLEGSGSDESNQGKTETKSHLVWDDISSAPGDDTAKFHELLIKARNKDIMAPFLVEDCLELEFSFWNLSEASTIDVLFVLKDAADYPLFSSGTFFSKQSNGSNAKGLYKASCEIGANVLNPGLFLLDVFLIKDGKDIIIKLPFALSFRISLPNGKTGSIEEQLTSPMKLNAPWNLRKVTEKAN